MPLPSWLQEALTLALQLSYWQQLGLAFLLGSFTVATWSDLKHLAAQREFLEVWLFFVLVMLIYDGARFSAGGPHCASLVLKWALIALFSALSVNGVGVLFRLAWGDVAALAAAACLLPPALVVVFYGTAKVLSLGIGPLLARGRRFYPFMPVVSLAAAVVLALGLLLA
jgi:hypothetical protein